jgi:guanylate kinase
MSHYDEFDYVVVNDRFEQAAVEVGEILDGGGHQLRSTRPELKPLIETLVRGVS